MLDKLDLEITEYRDKSARIFKIDTEFALESLFLTKKYEAKVKTVSGVTEISKPLVEGTYIAIIYKETRYSFRIVFLESDSREDIIVK